MTYNAIQKCLEQLDNNRFMLSLLLAQRTKELASGGQPRIDLKENKKNEIIAIHEIAEGKVDCDELKENIIRSHQNSFRRLRTETFSNNRDKDIHNFDEKNSIEHIIEEAEEKVYDAIDEEGMKNLIHNRKHYDSE